jgi:hypothetical protein
MAASWSRKAPCSCWARVCEASDTAT